MRQRLLILLLFIASVAAIPSPTTASPTATSTSTCQTVTPGKNGHVPPDACNAYWNYDPSFAAAVFMTFVFGFLGICHIVQAAVYRKGFCWVIIMGVVWEFSGYLIRALGAKNQQNLGYAIASQLLILLAPLCKDWFDFQDNY
jgi:hypothetical protein